MTSASRIKDKCVARGSYLLIHSDDASKYGGIIEYYESCREYIGKYYLRFERIWSGYAI